MAETKICKKCGRELPVDAFNAHKRTRDGLQPYCKECQAEIVKAGRQRRKAQAAEEPAEVKPALAAFTDDELMSELKARGYFWKDLYKYVKVNFDAIK